MNFIGQWFLENKKVCDDLIDFYERSDNKQPGTTLSNPVLEDRKKSTDLGIFPGDHIIPEVYNYLIELNKICEKYKKQYEFCNLTADWCISDGFNIQHYKPTEGFYAWHCERESKKHPESSRHLVWMTYLNDVTDGGETEWFYQNLKIKPQKGLTVIWPTDWTHTHRGIPSPTQEKYIITGWYNYVT